jgi:hypothetical protein
VQVAKEGQCKYDNACNKVCCHRGHAAELKSHPQ